MPDEKAVPTRFVGLDVHKHYLIAVAVDAELNQVWGPQRVQLSNLDNWMLQCLTRQDAVALEMTTNAFHLYDDLTPHVASVTVVHPPHVALITRAQVMTDKIAALTLARLLAVGLLPPVWVPPQAVRDQRALVAGRSKMVRLSTQAKNRLHAVLQRHHVTPPDSDLFAAAQRDWWLNLPVTPNERVRIQSDLDTLTFAQTQIGLFEETFVTEAAQDDRMTLLIQLPGISLVTARALLATIGDIRRFPTAEHLVGYAGLGGRVHDSGLTHRTGSITKAGRRDIRTPMVEAAHTASNTHPHWKAELARLEPRLGHNKTIVAIARKLLVAVWHVLTDAVADRYAEPESVARKLVKYTYRLGRDHRPAGQSTAEYVRQQLDRLGLGADLTAIAWGQQRTISLPPSRLAQEDSASPMDA
jgi:transposase